MADKWILTRNKLPPECNNVLVYIERNGFKNGKCIRKKEIAIGWHVGGSWHVDMCSGVVCIAWMKLPKPPQKETIQGGQHGRNSETKGRKAVTNKAGKNPA